MSEEVLLAGKYKTAEDLEKGYSELSKVVRERDMALNEYKTKYSAPEEYKFDGLQLPDSPMVKAALASMREVGLSNDMARKIVENSLKADMEFIESRKKSELEALGPDGKKLIDELTEFSTKALTDDEREILAGMTQTAAGTKLLHKLYTLTKGKDVPSARDVAQPVAQDPMTAAMEFRKQHGDKILRSRDLQEQYNALLAKAAR